MVKDLRVSCRSEAKLTNESKVDLTNGNKAVDISIAHCEIRIFCLQKFFVPSVTSNEK